jgi:alpha-L-rhamnosidase
MNRTRITFPVALVMVGVCPVGAAVTPTHLRCEYRSNPLGIDVAAPRLSWIVESGQRGERQTAYEIRVAGSREALQSDQADLWYSGKVSSDETAQISYGGRPLTSGQDCWWTVRCWDRDDHPSAYSPPARWTMGLLQPSDWKAQWISLETPPESPTPEPPIQNPKSAIQNPLVLPPSPFLRKSFSLDQPVQRAVLSVTALGLYEMHLNGHRVGNDLFRPGWTDFRKRLYYQTYDVTSLLSTGQNVLGAILGDGWACGYVGLGGRDRYGVGRPRLLAQLDLTAKDGSRQTIVTDGSWRGSYGPILASDMLMGETYDARREMPGWDSSAFQDADWQAVTSDAPWPAPLQAYPGVPVRNTLELKPRSVNEVSPGVFIFDLGQNMVGQARLAVSGPAGTTIRLRFGEVLNPDGTLYTANLRGARCTDNYTLRGGGPEVWEPRFTFRGFRYAEVTGYPGRPPLDALTGIVLHSDTPPAGTFACSNPLVNQLQHNIEWGQRGNFLEVPTDCPQRDERLGWMGDAQIFCRTACDNMDVAAFFTKWMQDVEDAQHPDGAFTDVSPSVAAGAGTAAWGDAGVVVPWTLYQVYGDTEIIHRHYAAMTRWIDYLQQHSAGLLRPASGYGDWVAAGASTPTDVLATAYFAYSTSLLARMARAIGKVDDAGKYEALFAQIRDAFDRAYLSPDGRIKGDTQTCYVLALQMDLLPDEQRAAAARHLVEDIESQGGHLSTGFVGTGYLAPVLTPAGSTDVAYRLITSDTYPSWGYEIRHGATTIWERWDGITPDGRFQDPGMNSFNHYAFGAVGHWLYSTVAGIDTDPDQPGFRHILIRPQPGGGLTWARATYDSIRGKISTAWNQDGGRLTLDVTIPANTMATIWVPAPSLAAVSESSRLAATVEGLRFRDMEAGSAVFDAGSGEYHFTVAGNQLGKRARQRAVEAKARGEGK